MKEIFSVPKLKKDGTPGKTMLLPPVEELQMGEDTREQWIEYSVYDSESTWELREVLQGLLERRHWVKDRTMYDFYQQYWAPYGELLTDMERAGIQVSYLSLAR